MYKTKQLTLLFIITLLLPFVSFSQKESELNVIRNFERNSAFNHNNLCFYNFYGFFMHLVQSQQLNAKQIPFIIFVHFFVSNKITKLWKTLYFRYVQKQVTAITKEGLL